MINSDYQYRTSRSNFTPGRPECLGYLLMSEKDGSVLSNNKRSLFCKPLRRNMSGGFPHKEAKGHKPENMMRQSRATSRQSATTC